MKFNFILIPNIITDSPICKIITINYLIKVN